MNIRAIALGAVVGFVVAIAPSCGGSKCSPANCNGCCDKAGKCVQKANSANNTTCGNQGVACADCSAAGQVCNPTTYACTTGSGGGGGVGGGVGGGAGGGSGGCDGCRLPSGTCVPLSNTSVNNCGVAGAACAPCATGQLCTNGVCTTPVITKKIGEGCANNAECASIGTGAICKTATSTGNGTYAGGYCTLPCGTGTPVGTNCPSGSRCVGLDPRYGESDVFCWDTCGTGDGCRSPGYACYTLGSFSACWLNPLPSIDAGPPADKIGLGCTADTQCENPPDPGTGGACIPEVCASTFGLCPKDGGTPSTGYTGGYCTRFDCNGNSDCSADGGALCLGIGGGDTECFRHCLAGNAGQSDCRAGYVCNAYVKTLADGGREQSTDGYCDPNCNNVPGFCGSYSDGGAVTCTDAGYCQYN